MNLIRWIGFGIVITAATLHPSAQQAARTTVAPIPTGGVMARVGGNVASAPVSPNAYGIIQGNALDSTNRQLANATIRLRDARYGGILGTQITDDSGLFAFNNLQPGSYIAELIGNDDTVLAASELLNINAGDAASAIVKLPFRLPFADIVGTVAPNSASAIITQAIATGLMGVAIIGEPTCSQ